jgi:hypothetical protein
MLGCLFKPKGTFIPAPLHAGAGAGAHLRSYVGEESPPLPSSGGASTRTSSHLAVEQQRQSQQEAAWARLKVLANDVASASRSVQPQQAQAWSATIVVKSMGAVPAEEAGPLKQVMEQLVIETRRADVAELAMRRMQEQQASAGNGPTASTSGREETLQQVSRS